MTRYPRLLAEQLYVPLASRDKMVTERWKRWKSIITYEFDQDALLIGTVIHPGVGYIYFGVLGGDTY